MISVLVVDDEAVVRQGICSLLSMEQDLNIVGQAQNGLKAVELAKSLNPDVILMDIRMPVCDGLEALGKILKERSSTKVIMLTTFDDDSSITRALGSGAIGYLLKDTDSEKIAAAIRLAAQGIASLNVPILAKVLNHPKPVEQDVAAMLTKLSVRETEVLRLIGKGSSNKEIAAALFLTEGTVKNYVTEIFEKLGVRNRADAASIAQKHLKKDASDDNSPYLLG
jgi:DNA-binding NarL/FixJ family response regulator